MSMVTEKYDYVIGIDTHARTHTYAAINTRTGAREHCEAFPVTPAGMRRAIAWLRRSSTGEVLAAVEGTRSYGSSITAMLSAESIPVVEVLFRYRANLSVFFLGVCLTSLVGLVLTQAFGAPELTTSLWLLPGVLIGALVSKPLVRRVPVALIRPASLGLCLVAGAGLVLKGIQI